MDSKDLFSPLQLGSCALTNRIVMAPMTRNRAAEGNIPQEINRLYYEQRASAGLIITEGAQISPQGAGYPFTPGIYNNEQVSGWKKITTAIHQKGSHIFIQLWHVGRISHPSLQPDNALPVAPSPIKPDGDAFTYSGLQPFVQPHALETGEIDNIIDDYRQAARHALDAGFDGVEIHAANGYLIDQFLRDGSNNRTDEYGGSLENRSRFLLQVLEAVTSVCDSQRVGVRLSPLNSFNSMHDSDPTTLFSYVVQQLKPLKLAYLHILEGSMSPLPEADKTFDYKKLAALYDGIYMANHGYDRQSADEAIKSGTADLVSFGIPYIANPDLVERLKADALLNTADQASFYGGDEKGYTDYSFLPS